jgi:RNA polymerase sigma-70 factor (ECF subfamily)
MTERDTDAVSDLDLIKRAQAEDLDAFCLLAERYARRIYLLASHYCRNPHDAEDLSQEVWLKAYQAVRTFRFDSSFYTWLRRITINAFLNHRRASFFRSHGQTMSVQLLQIDSEEQQCFRSRVRGRRKIFITSCFLKVS